MKTQLLVHVLGHSNFPGFSLPESCSQTDKFPKNSLHSCISIICECAHIALCFPSRRPILQCGLQKYTSQVISFRIEHTRSLSTFVKVLKLISVYNLHPRTKELCWRLLDSRLLAKKAYWWRTTEGLFKKEPLILAFPCHKSSTTCKNDSNKVPHFSRSLASATV